MRYEITYYSERVAKEILAFPPKVKAKYFRITELMEEFGSDLGLPYTKAMGDGLFEIRAKGQEGIGRVFYCTKVGQKIVILHAFIKKTQKTPAKELSIARSRLNEVKNGQ